MARYDFYGNLIEKDKSVPDFTPLQGKYCLAIGDSYTNALAGANGALTKLNAELGMAGTLNHGIVGSTFRDGNGTGGFANRPIVCRVLNVASNEPSTVSGEYVPMDRTDIGYITLMGGTNDSYGYPTSTGDNPLNTDITTIVGAVNMTVQKLIESYPNVPILLMTEPEYSNSSLVSGLTDAPDLTGDYTAVHSSDASGIKNGYVLGAMIAHRKQRFIYDTYKFWADAYPNVYLLDFCFDWYHVANPNDSHLWSAGDDRLHLAGGYEEIVRGTKFNSILSTLQKHFTNGVEL